MIIKELRIKGLFEIILEPHLDSRGFFMRTYDKKLFAEHNIIHEWVQENHSRTEEPGTIRGLHFQVSPYAETKLVRCIKGAIFDVAVDLRIGSETFGMWIGLELSEENRKQLLIPRGFAHGFCSLTRGCEVVYKVDNYYSQEHERGIIWNDAELNISWPVNNPILSKKDKDNISLRNFIQNV